jgi:hypothetical protein
LGLQVAFDHDGCANGFDRCLEIMGVHPDVLLESRASDS